jgi:lysophospholipase L1-like esterase
MRRNLGFTATLLLLVPAAPLNAAEPEFFFKEGDRIVFLGDSITEQYQYSTDIELYLTTRFPKWKLTFINAGIGGDTATGGANRFLNHVLAEKPTALTINFGMNDGGYGGFNKNRHEAYVNNTAKMLEMAKKAKVRVALLSPNAVERRNHPNLKQYLETQKEFYAPLKDLAAKHEVSFVDQYAVTRAGLEKMEEADPMAKKFNPFPDGVHTSPAGGLFMAHAILTGLHAPAVVSDVAIDAGTSKDTPKNCRIEGLKCAKTSVEFDRTDDALPIPVPVIKDWAALLPYMNELKDLNWYGLKVTGLEAGTYAVNIDNKEVATFTAEQLSKGVNLGNLTSGPIFEQGQKVFDAIQAKNGLVHQRFRNVVMFQAPDWLADVAAERKPKELAKRMEKIDAAQAEIYKLVQPTVHHFEVKQK